MSGVARSIDTDPPGPDRCDLCGAQTTNLEPALIRTFVAGRFVYDQGRRCIDWDGCWDRREEQREEREMRRRGR